MTMNKKEKGEIAGLRTELKTEITEIRKEMRDSSEELRRHMGVLVEGVRSEMGIIAEQHGSIITKLEEHDRRFDVIDIDLKAITRIPDEYRDTINCFGGLFGMNPANLTDGLFHKGMILCQ